MSPITSTAIGRSSSSTRAWKQVYSLRGERVDLAADRVERDGDVHRRAPRVPLNSRCSRKCEAPGSVGVSSREPTPTQTPTLAERTPGIVSVTTRSPPGRTVRRTRDAPPGAVRSLSRVRVEPGCGLGCVRQPSSDSASLGVRCLGRPRPSASLLDDRDQRQLAAVVDLGDLDLDLLADGDDVLDVLDPLAAGELAELADVQQAVLAGQQRDERTEGGGLDHGAEVALADLGHVGLAIALTCARRPRPTGRRSHRCTWCRRPRSRARRRSRPGSG